MIKIQYQTTAAGKHSFYFMHIEPLESEEVSFVELKAGKEPLLLTLEEPVSLERYEQLKLPLIEVLHNIPLEHADLKILIIQFMNKKKTPAPTPVSGPKIISDEIVPSFDYDAVLHNQLLRDFGVYNEQVDVSFASWLQNSTPSYFSGYSTPCLFSPGPECNKISDVPHFEWSEIMDIMLHEP